MRAVVATTRYALASVAGGATCFCGFPGFDSSARAATSGQKHLPCPRYNVPLQRRYKGTSAERSRRAKMLMSDAEVSAAAQLINNFVDLDFYDEDEEQEIFERPRGVFARAPPDATRPVLGSAEYELPHDDMVKFEKRMFDAALGLFSSRLETSLACRFDWLLARADLPFLDETDQRRVVHRLLVLLMRSMHKRKSAVGALTELETHTLVLDVFVKGTIDIFQDPAQRRALVERIEFYVSSVPFFPTPLLEHLIVWWCEKATAVVTPVLVETYNEHLCRVDIYAEVALCSAEQLPNLDDKPFTALLRENLTRAFTRPKKHGRDRNVSLVTLALSLLPEKTARTYALLFVDSFLESLRTDKLEQIMYNIVLNDVLQQGLINQPLFISKCYDKDKRDDEAASSGAPPPGARHRVEGARRVDLAPRRVDRAILLHMAARSRSGIHRVLDAVGDDLVAHLGLFEMMRLALTSNAFLSGVCSRVRTLDLDDAHLRGCDSFRENQVTALLRCATAATCA
ncbi:ATPase [Aureococcus anophagefferens]|nr:ATPase [Aureococcus anophagefferens]